MKTSGESALQVALESVPPEPIAVGRLALEQRVAAFEYDAVFLTSTLRLNPLDRATIGVIRPRDRLVFDGLHGVFADSLPDAWGRKLMRRRAAQLGTDYATFGVLDKLAAVGRPPAAVAAAAL